MAVVDGGGMMVEWCGMVVAVLVVVEWWWNGVDIHMLVWLGASRFAWKLLIRLRHCSKKHTRMSRCTPHPHIRTPTHYHVHAQLQVPTQAHDKLTQVFAIMDLHNVSASLK